MKSTTEDYQDPLPRIDVRDGDPRAMELRPMLNGKDVTRLGVVWLDGKAGTLGAWRKTPGDTIRVSDGQQATIHLHRGRVDAEGNTPAAVAWLARQRVADEAVG